MKQEFIKSDLHVYLHCCVLTVSFTFRFSVLALEIINILIQFLSVAESDGKWLVHVTWAKSPWFKIWEGL